MRDHKAFVLNRAKKISEKMTSLQGTKAGDICVLQIGIMIICAQQDILENLNSDPKIKYGILFDNINHLINLYSPLFENSNLKSDLLDKNNFEIDNLKKLFENAWTIYNEKTYDHSVSLVKARLVNSKLDENFFNNKTCFDGGCGTGRLSIAISLLGCKKIIAADIGQKSLDFMLKQANRLGASVTPKKLDVTNLSEIEDETFDFVASYGVLHHTENMRGGLKEHMRVLKQNGYFWLYLYGSDSLYWSIYDIFRDVMRNYTSEEIRWSLNFLGVREGLIYTFLDNFLAPRQYIDKHEIQEIARSRNCYIDRNAKGINTVDDPKMQQESLFGEFILGPDCEHRYILRKKIKS